MAVPISRSASSNTSRDTQVGACTPLVTDEIGTSAASKPGHRSLNIPRLTMPCSFATPLRRCASRSPMWAMLKTVGSSSSPSSSTRSSGTPWNASPVKTPSISSRGKRSMPAGTGVCVVKTVPARTASSASS